MKCPTCDFETEDNTLLTTHMMDCEGEPEEKWDSYIQLEVDQATQIGKLSDQLEDEG